MHPDANDDIMQQYVSVDFKRKLLLYSIILSMKGLARLVELTDLSEIYDAVDTSLAE